MYVSAMRFCKNICDMLPYGNARYLLRKCDIMLRIAIYTRFARVRSYVFKGHIASIGISRPEGTYRKFR